MAVNPICGQNVLLKNYIKKLLDYVIHFFIWERIGAKNVIFQFKNLNAIVCLTLIEKTHELIIIFVSCQNFQNRYFVLFLFWKTILFKNARFVFRFFFVVNHVISSFIEKWNLIV